MTIFIFIFLSIYSVMHAIFFMQIRVILPDGMLIKSLCITMLIFLILSPLLCHLLEKSGYEISAHIFAVIAFYWMGFIFLAFVGCLIMRILDIILWTIYLFFSVNTSTLFAKTPTFIMLGTVTALCIYGSFEARSIQIKQLNIITNKLPADIDRIRVVQISDLHIGLLIRHNRLRFIMEKVASTEPDILVCTGDVVDINPYRMNDLADMLGNIHCRYGKYAVTGNHEYYAGLKHAVDFMQRAGFVVLQNEILRLPVGINVAGIDDASSRVKSTDETNMLSKIQDGRFTILLKHRPLILEKSLGLFDLQLSGHTHGGQIFPFNLVVSLPFPFIKGYYDLGKGSALYVNQGTGTWGPQIRLLSPPEITVIELRTS